MPFNENQPRLLATLAWIPLKPVVKKPLFGERYIRFYDCFATLGFLFESCALIGRAKREQLNLLTDMLVHDKSKVDGIIEELKEVSVDRLNKFIVKNGKNPKSFQEYITQMELDKALSEMDGLTWDDRVKEYVSGNKKVAKVFDQKLTLDSYLKKAAELGKEGIIFGVLYPELTESMIRNTYENIDLESWNKAKRFGVDIPEKPEYIPFEEREKSALSVVAAYTAEFYPELVGPLGFGDIIKAMGLKENVATPLEVNRDYKWTDIIGQVFHVLEFNRSGTIIEPSGKVKAKSSFKPYGCLLVESPIINTTMKIDICHKDDFILAASVFDEPKWLEVIKKEELLVTYVPKNKLPGGLVGVTHGLHYVIVPNGTLDRYYKAENGANRTNLELEKIFGTLVWDGLLKVQVNNDPQF